MPSAQSKTALAAAVLLLLSCDTDVSAPPQPLERPQLALQALNGLPPVRISEIHYDNTGTDAGEAIEISGALRTLVTRVIASVTG